MANATHERLRTRRIYDPPEPGDGVRLLVDRVWPRGVRRADARIDGWRRDLAPSTQLRRWFGHDPGRWREFLERYEAELSGREGELDELADIARERGLTLLFAARDTEHNNAEALRRMVARRLG